MSAGPAEALGGIGAGQRAVHRAVGAVGRAPAPAAERVLK